MIRRIARPMIASFYVLDGVDALTGTEKHAEATRPLLETVRGLLPKQYALFVPKDPAVVAQGMGAAKVAAGSLLALGKCPRIATGTLAALSIPSILVRHAFWNSTNEQEKSEKRSGFVTDMALLGGLFIATADTQGKPGLKWRATHAAQDANKAIQRALPTKSETEKFTESALEQASVLGVATKGFLADAGEKLTAYASDVQDYVGNVQSDVQSYVDDNKDDWLKAAQKNTKVAKKRLVKAAEKAQKRAEKAQKEASKKAPKLQKKAEKAIKKAQKKLDKKIQELS